MQLALRLCPLQRDQLSCPSLHRLLLWLTLIQTMKIFHPVAALRVQDLYEKYNM